MDQGKVFGAAYFVIGAWSAASLGGSACGVMTGRPDTPSALRTAVKILEQQAIHNPLDIYGLLSYAERLSADLCLPTGAVPLKFS